MSSATASVFTGTMATAQKIHSDVAAVCHNASAIASEEARRYGHSAGQNGLLEYCHSTNAEHPSRELQNYARHQAKLAHRDRINREWDEKQGTFFHELAENMSDLGRHHDQIAHTYANERQVADKKPPPPGSEQGKRLAHSVQKATRDYDAASSILNTVRRRADSFGQHHPTHPRQDHRPRPGPNYFPSPLRHAPLLPRH